jgi:hypothetical protein
LVPHSIKECIISIRLTADSLDCRRYEATRFSFTTDCTDDRSSNRFRTALVPHPRNPRNPWLIPIWLTADSSDCRRDQTCFTTKAQSTTKKSDLTGD